MNQLFYELIQVAIGSRTYLTRSPSVKEWQLLYQLSIKQALIGICFNGVQYISEYNKEQVVNLSKDLRMKWFGMSVIIHNRNKKLNRQCMLIQKQFLSEGFNTCILKGQGVANFYNTELSLFRQSGDIDIWVDSTWKAVMDYINTISPNREFDMKHTHLNIFPDTIVEVHWWPSMPINPFYRNALHSYYQEQISIQCQHQIVLCDGTIISAPEAKFEVIHVMYHIFNHFLYEGIGLRQMMDLYFIIVNGKLSDYDKVELLHTFNRVGLSSFAPATMWVLCEVFNMSKSLCIGPIDERSGKILLNEIEEGGNFGNHNAENHVYKESFTHRMVRRLKRRIRLIKYNPLGVITSPITKVKTLLWKRKVIKMYNL